MLKTSVLSVGLLLAGCSAKPAAQPMSAQVPRVHFDGNAQVSTADLDAVTVLDHPERMTDNTLVGGQISLATREAIEAANHQAPSLDRAGAKNVLGPDRTALLYYDVLRVLQVYYDRGYVTADVKDPAVTVAKDGKIDVAIHVDEGARFRIAHITVSDPEAAQQDPLLREPLGSQDGAWFSRATLEKDMTQLRARYAQAGFTNASVEPAVDIDPEHKTLSVKVEIQRNPN